jgi:hypothetical protein
MDGGYVLPAHTLIAVCFAVWHATLNVDSSAPTDQYEVTRNATMDQLCL